MPSTITIVTVFFTVINYAEQKLYVILLFMVFLCKFCGILDSWLESGIFTKNPQVSIT